ncbi:hypothetical protein CERSUDRAFT_89984 [Gelatoporia subvermispora B]|uniref:Uncharacterized protein n=1 Tax=Ceriporiopsis subvermispora (strain B) TaxID=914234 RepID=M2QWG2_CERS8|nr:hypothetical protein CERSUDRAFT_89984 [Gelatoporia subvermispora B]
MLLALSLPLLSLVTSLIPSVENRLVNVTIDDTYGDPTTGAQFTYVDSEWKPGQGCSGCLAQPDPSLAWNGSWHDATFNHWPGYVPEPNVPLNATVSFNGQALYVYCIIDNNQDQNSYMTFYIDDEVVGSYIKNASNQSSYDYNVLVYQNQALNPGQHTFMLSSGQVNGTDALVLLDYVIYTVDVESNSTSSAPAASLSGLPSSTSSILTSLPQSSPSLLPSSSLQTLPSSDTTASTTMITSSINVTSSGKATSTSSLYSGTTIGTAAAATSSRNGMSSAQLKLTVIIIVVVVVGTPYRRTDADELEEVVAKLFDDGLDDLYVGAGARNFLLIDVPPKDRSPAASDSSTDLAERYTTWNDLLEAQT